MCKFLKSNNIWTYVSVKKICLLKLYCCFSNLSALAENNRCFLLLDFICWTQVRSLMFESIQLNRNNLVHIIECIHIPCMCVESEVLLISILCRSGFCSLLKSLPCLFATEHFICLFILRPSCLFKWSLNRESKLLLKFPHQWFQLNQPQLVY